MATPLHPVPLRNNDSDGIWLERTEAAQLLRELEHCKILKDANVIQDQLITKLQLQVHTATTSLNITDNMLSRSEELSNHWHDAYVAELKQQQSVWNEPLLWATLGIILGGAVAGVSAYAATR